jgi:hypothetical protein
VPTHVLEDRGDLEEAEAGSPVDLRDRDPQEPGLRHLFPERVVEARTVGPLDLALPLVGGLVREDLARELCDRQLVFAQ